IGDYLTGLERLSSLPVRLVVPGHGTVGDGADFRRRVAADIAYLEELEQGANSADPRLSAPWLIDEHERQVSRVTAPPQRTTTRRRGRQAGHGRSTVALRCRGGRKWAHEIPSRRPDRCGRGRLWAERAGRGADPGQGWPDGAGHRRRRHARWRLPHRGAHA